MGKFIKNKSVFFLCIICLAGLSAAVTIEVESTPRQQMKYGMDYERLWFWYGSLDRAKCAELSVVDCNLDYLRVAIHCGYELEEGVFDESAYDKILEMMTYMKAANPNIKFFGSPRPLNDLVKDAPWCPFPLWINVYTQNDDGSWKYVEFKWEKAAEYLIRYVQFMKLHGFRIHYIDMTNEWNKVTPTHVKLMRARMEAELGDDMPLVIAPSAWSFTQGVNWLNDATNQDEIDAIDIPACHNTGNQGTPLDFATKAFSLGKEAWDSEMHGWVGKETIDEIPTSNVLWERVRAGFSGLDSWLALGTVNQQHCYILNKSGVPTPNVKYYIFKKVSNTSNYGYAITTSQPSEFESTAGFIKDNTATVWVLNNSSSDIADVEFKIDGHTILSDSVERTRWHHSISIEGVVDSVVKSSQTTFQSTIKANSLYCFHYQTEIVNNDNSMIANYKFDKNTYDSSGHRNNATIVGASNYSDGVIENSINLDGAENYLKATDLDNLIGQRSKSIAGWLKTNLSSYSPIILEWGDLSQGNKTFINLLSSGQLSINSGSNFTWNNTKLNDDKWHHFAIVIDDDGTPAFDEIKIYIDGQLKKNTYPNSNNIINVNLDGTVFIGAHESDTEQFNRFFKGQLDDIRIYDYPIGGERIAELYFAGIDDGRICLEEHSPLSYDYNNNCMVEIDDLLVFSALWLNVNFWDDFSGLYNQWLADSAFRCGGIIYRQTGYNGDVQQLTYLNSISDLHGAENCWARLESTNGVFLENRSDCFNNQIGDRTLCINENAGSAYYNTGIEMSDFVGAEINLSVFAGQRWADSVIGTYQINSLTTNGTLQTLATETYTTSYSGKLEQSTELRYIVAPQDQGKLVVRLTQEEPNSGRAHFDGIRLGWCINRPIY